MLAKITIAHLNNISQLSGSQLVSIDVLESLDPQKYKKYIICGIDEVGRLGFEARCRNADIEIILIQSSSRRIGVTDFIYFIDLFKIFLKFKFDIVHTNSTKQGLFGRIAARLAGIRLILHTVHGIAYHRGQNFFKRFIFYLLDIIGTIFCDHQVLVNQYYQKYYRWIPWVKSTTIKNGVDLCNINNISATVPRAKKKIILFLARMEPQKDPLTLLRAISFLKKIQTKTLEKIVFRFVGDGGLMDECISYANRNGISENVEFIGWSDDKWGELNNATLVCVPSIHEACGIAFLEAGLLEIPVVSTNVEGIPEVIIDGSTGLLSKVGDHEKLAKNILYFIENEKQCLVYGQKAKSHVMNNYDIRDMKLRYAKLYNTLRTR